jgi:prepilin-type N-terminal cleavage/methylation domain-containing protein
MGQQVSTDFRGCTLARVTPGVVLKRDGGKAEVIAMRRNAWARPQRSRGFTLVELMVVMIVISILVAITMANYIRMKRHAETASCIANQRNIIEAAVTYSIDTVVPDGDMNVGDLIAAGAVSTSLCDCPAEKADDHDDYTITWLDGHPRDVTCEVKGAEHDWQPH